MKRGKKPYFTPQQVQRMVDAKAEGLTYKEIAKVYGVWCETIRHYIKDFQRGKSGGTSTKST